MIAIAGGIIIGVIGLCVIILAVIYWPITLIAFIVVSLTEWLHLHGWV